MDDYVHTKEDDDAHEIKTTTVEANKSLATLYG